MEQENLSTPQNRQQRRMMKYRLKEYNDIQRRHQDAIKRGKRSEYQIVQSANCVDTYVPPSK